MKITLTNKPDSFSFIMCGDVKAFHDAIINENRVCIDMIFHTKTRISLSANAGNRSFKINEPSQFSMENNIVLVEERTPNYFSGGMSVNNYFKLTKKQNLDVLKKHIVSLVEGQILKRSGIESLVNKDTFEIIVWTPRELLV